MDMILPEVKDENGNTLYERAAIKDLIPRGKDKSVTFQKVDFQPYQVQGKRGMITPPIKKGAEKSILASATVVLPEYFDSASNSKQASNEGVLQYYEKSNARMVNREKVEQLTPERVFFVRGTMRIDADKQWSLFAYMLLRPDNVRSAGWSRVKPVVKLVEAKDGRRKSTAKVSLLVQAINKIDSLQTSSQRAFRTLYEACGFTDYDMYTVSDGRGGFKPDWDALKAPLYQLAEQNPQSIIDKIDDKSLDITAKVNISLETGLLKYENGIFYWGPKSIKADAKEKDAKICQAPKGKQNLEMAKVWFVGFLQGEPDTMAEINAQIESVKQGQ